MNVALSDFATDAEVHWEERFTRRIFWLFVGWHAIVWTLVPLLTQTNRPLDMVEMLFWGHGWQWGYHKHPPLPAWIAASVFQLTGGAVWPLYLVAQSAVVASFWAAWTLAKEFLKPWPALCASVLLEACYYYNYTTADLNNSIVLQPFWALAALALYRALTREQLRYWAATGACLGFGMLSKYDIAVLVFAMLLLPAINRRARSALVSWGPLVTAAIGLLIFSPHLIWMVQHDFPTVQYALKRGGITQSAFSHVVYPLEFILSQSLALAPLVALAWPLWRRGIPDRSQPRAEDGLRRDFLWVVCLGPLAFDLVLAAVTGVKLLSMWGAPMWTLSGVALLYFANRRVDRDVCRVVVTRCAAAGCVLAMGLAARNTVGPYFSAKGSRVHFPGPQLAQEVEHQWRQYSDTPLPIVAGPWWHAGNVGLALSRSIEMYDFYEPENSPWSSDTELRKRGGIIVWQNDREGALVASSVRHRFPEAKILSPIDINWQTGANLPPARFQMAVVLPHGQQDTSNIATRPSPAGAAPPNTGRARLVNTTDKSDDSRVIQAGGQER